MTTRRSFVQACLAFVGLGAVCKASDKPTTRFAFKGVDITPMREQWQKIDGPKFGDMRIVRVAREWGTEVRYEEYMSLCDGMASGWVLLCKSFPDVNYNGISTCTIKVS